MFPLCSYLPPVNWLEKHGRAAAKNTRDVRIRKIREAYRTRREPTARIRITRAARGEAKVHVLVRDGESGLPAVAEHRRRTYESRVAVCVLVPFAPVRDR